MLPCLLGGSDHLSKLTADSNLINENRRRYFPLKKRLLQCTEFSSCHLKHYCYLEWKLFQCCSTSDTSYQLLNDINIEINLLDLNGLVSTSTLNLPFHYCLVASLPNYYPRRAIAAFRVSSLHAVLTHISRQSTSNSKPL